MWRSRSDGLRDAADRETSLHVHVAGDAAVAISPIAVVKLTRHVSILIVTETEGNVTTFHDFQRRFPDEVRLAHVMNECRGGTGIDCLKCGRFSKFNRMASERAYVCQYCKTQIHPEAEILVHRSRTTLRDWFFAICMFSTSWHGVAAKKRDRWTQDSGRDDRVRGSPACQPCGTLETPCLKGRTEEFRSLVVELLARGLSVRDIKDALRQASGLLPLSPGAPFRFGERPGKDCRELAKRILGQHDVVHPSDLNVTFPSIPCLMRQHGD